MQGFNRYYPSDYDPKVNPTLNSVHGKHALGVRARKIDQGILITRFEMPFNIWCGGCDAHIGQGVRFNAEKRRVGEYYSTAIYAFRCKCHLCSHWFEIQTDPKNTRYVVTEGAREKHEQWDPKEAGQFVLDQKDPDAVVDPLARVEKLQTDKINALSNAERIEAIQTHNDDNWSDPYTLSKRLRTTFRADKKERKIRDESDTALKARLSLPADLRLLDDTVESRDEAHAEWLAEKEKLATLFAERRQRQQRAEIETAPISIAKRPRPSSKTSIPRSSSLSGLNKPSTSSSSVKAGLSAQLLRASRQSFDPFTSKRDAVPVLNGTIKRKRDVLD